MRAIIFIISFAISAYSTDLEISGVKADVKNQILKNEKRLIFFIKESKTELPLPSSVHIDNNLNPATILVTFTDIDSFLINYILKKEEIYGKEIYSINARPLSSFIHFGLDKWLDFICNETKYYSFLKMNISVTLLKNNGTYLSFFMGPKIIDRVYDLEKARTLYNFIIIGNAETGINKTLSWDHNASWIFDVSPYEDLKGFIKPENFEYLLKYFFKD